MPGPLPLSQAEKNESMSSNIDNFFHSGVIPFPFQVQVDPDDLIPKLPRPRDLQPFPTTQAIVRARRGGPCVINP